MLLIRYRMNSGWVKMNLLLDTHIFVWWDKSSALLPQHAAELCSNQEHQLFLSIASIWEIQIKHKLGKLPLVQPLRKIIEDHQVYNRLQLLPIKPEHVFALETLPLHHRDPFDRLSIAQQQIENMRLLAVDVEFEKYGLEVIQR